MPSTLLGLDAAFIVVEPARGVGHKARSSGCFRPKFRVKPRKPAVNYDADVIAVVNRGDRLPIRRPGNGPKLPAWAVDRRDSDALIKILKARRDEVLSKALGRAVLSAFRLC